MQPGPPVLLAGGGFAGLWCTRALASAPVRITLVDKANDHLFQPLLYQVATAGLSGPDIAAPLASFPPALQQRTKTQLESLGVQVCCGTPVADITNQGYRLGDRFVPCRTVLWAAGVAASPLGAMLGVPLDRSGRVKINPDLTPVAPGEKRRQGPQPDGVLGEEVLEHGAQTQTAQPVDSDVLLECAVVQTPQAARAQPMAVGQRLPTAFVHDDHDQPIDSDIQA
jgi:NADPH-dependent 2,4-dienoyl-CoA reductase/sulfur reductase-like enzyme